MAAQPVVPTILEAEAGGLLESRNLRPTQATQKYPTSKRKF
jgi:hypothetical protein